WRRGFPPMTWHIIRKHSQDVIETALSAKPLQCARYSRIHKLVVRLWHVVHHEVLLGRVVGQREGNTSGISRYAMGFRSSGGLRYAMGFRSTCSILRYGFP